MNSAAEEFVDYIESAHFANAAYPVIQNYDAKPSQDANEIKVKLAKQIASSVKWSQTIHYMVAQGVDIFIEIGPGKALSGMVKKLAKDAQVFNISSLETLKAVIPLLPEITA
jgi:[acyl-carrier-protein] S-malonyltransferase